MKKLFLFTVFLTLLCTGFLTSSPVYALSEAFQDKIYIPKNLKPIDSILKVNVGSKAPDFTLPSLQGENISLSQYYGKKIVVISTIPAAWTPVCSDQWPGYNIIKDLFDSYDAILLGISTDNIPSLFAWTHQMGNVWFPVLSDFWPHGSMAERYGILRSDGTMERTIFIIDKKGFIQYIDIHNINSRPSLESIVQALEKMKNIQ